MRVSGIGADRKIAENSHGVGGGAADARRTVLSARLERQWPVVAAGLAQLYPATADLLGERLQAMARDFVEVRREDLWVRDLSREANPGWFQSSRQVGYVCYADLFAGTLNGVAAEADYLAELGVTYLHLMPLLRPREGANDGGYAVAAYDEVDPALGTMRDLAGLAEAMHARHVNLCIDLVLNHTAADHDWAVRARAGDPEYRKRYLIFPDRVVPDRWEQSLLEVFPATAPGNFTQVPAGEGGGDWVWTTFNDFQWDLNWAEPDVFEAMFAVMLHLAEQGIDMLRLDAAPFMWKRNGTICQNLPEVHVLLTTMRALMAVAAPATAFKAEAIVGPDDLPAYVGAGLTHGDPSRHECDLAYNNQLMVLLWSSVATGDAALMTNALARMQPIPQNAAWVNYVRCHDDIGWAITSDDAASVGWDATAHRDFLLAFYSGAFPGSFANGAVFQYNPVTRDGRTSGTAASLCGIEEGLTALASGDSTQLDSACARLELMYAVVYGFGGIPLLYMGDELGLCNDTDYLLDPAKADDNRWMHRPRMNWTTAERRRHPGTLEARLFDMFAGLATDRGRIGAIDASGALAVLRPNDPHVFAFTRRHPAHGSFTMVANFGRQPVDVNLAEFHVADADILRSAGVLASHDITATLDASGYLWLAAPVG